MGRGVTGLVARLISLIFAPAVIIVVLCLAVAWHATEAMIPALGWGALAALFASGLPMMVVLRGVNRGTLSDMHVRHRSQRAVPLMAAAISALSGVVLLSLVDAPGEVTAIAFAMLSGLLGFGVITVWWKVSFHAGVSAASVAVLTGLYGSAVLTTLPLVLLIAWSRVRIGDHTIPQVAAGVVCGPVAAGVAFVLASLSKLDACLSLCSNRAAPHHWSILCGGADGDICVIKQLMLGGTWLSETS